MEAKFIAAWEANREKAVVTVENQGAATQEIVQLYIRDSGSEYAPPNPILCGFLRIDLEQGETKTVEIPLDPKAFTVVNAQGQRVEGSGSWTLYAGTGQPDARTEALTGKKAVSIPVK